MIDTTSFIKPEGWTVSVEYDRKEADTGHQSPNTDSRTVFISAKSGNASQTKTFNFSTIREKEKYIKINQRLGE